MSETFNVNTLSAVSLGYSSHSFRGSTASTASGLESSNESGTQAPAMPPDPSGGQDLQRRGMHDPEQCQDYVSELPATPVKFSPSPDPICPEHAELVFELPASFPAKSTKPSFSPDTVYELPTGLEELSLQPRFTASESALTPSLRANSVAYPTVAHRPAQKTSPSSVQPIMNLRRGALADTPTLSPTHGEGLSGTASHLSSVGGISSGPPKHSGSHPSFLVPGPPRHIKKSTANHAPDPDNSLSDDRGSYSPSLPNPGYDDVSPKPIEGNSPASFDHLQSYSSSLRPGSHQQVRTPTANQARPSSLDWRNPPTYQHSPTRD